MDESDVSSEESMEEDDDMQRPPRREVISFGDSMEERTATRIVSNQLDSVAKTVMFLSSPDPVQVIAQLEIVANHMEQVCTRESPLDTEITLEQTRSSARVYARERQLEGLFRQWETSITKSTMRGSYATSGSNGKTSSTLAVLSSCGKQSQNDSKSKP